MAHINLSILVISVNKRTGNDIYKTNQQYQLIVAYDFVGPSRLAEIVRERHEDQITTYLPLGYSVRETDRNYWYNPGKKRSIT